jgi:Protein of unknown function (DUF3800)
MLREFGSYCDEFGHAKDRNKKYMGIAGLMAWSDNWRTFTEEWEQFLNDEKIPKPFHMTDFVHHSEKFSDARWENSEERKRIFLHLLSIIERAEVIPIAASVVLEDYNGLTEEEQKLCRGPYYLAFQAVTSNMGFAAGSLDLNSKIVAATKAYEENTTLDHQDLVSSATVSMVYAKLRGFTGPAEELWHAIKKGNMFGAWMRSYTPGEPRDYPPLQAADIWAYSVGHHGEHNPPKNIEAQIALDFFVDRAMKLSHGAHWFTFLNREEILIRIGKLPELA